MNISKINNIKFGLKFSDRAEKLFQKSQDYIADIAIKTKNDDIVIKNNLNRVSIENALGDEVVLDAEPNGQTSSGKEEYTFFIKNMKNKLKKRLSLKYTDINNILNGKVWNELAESLIKSEDKISR